MKTYVVNHDKDGKTLKIQADYVVLEDRAAIFYNRKHWWSCRDYVARIEYVGSIWVDGKVQIQE